MSRWRALSVAAAAALCGCSLIVATDGLSDGAGGALGDRADGGDGGSPATGDGSTMTDAGAESGGEDAASDAGTPPFCASLSPKPRYCADFDKGTIFDYGRLVGTPTLDTGVSKSAPASMLAMVEADATERDSKTYEDFTETPQSFDVAFDILVEEYDGAHDVELGNVVLSQPSNKSCILGVAVRGGQWCFDESCGNGSSYTVNLDHRSSISLQRSQWVHVAFSASFVSQTFSVTVDGQSAFADVPLQAGVATGTASLAMGINYLQTAATSRAKLHVDNVTFDDK